MAETFAGGDNDSRESPLPLEQHLSVESRPLLIMEPSHISPMPLHLTLGITSTIL